MLAMSDITIDPELESLLPPLSDSEFDELIQNINANGFTDPLIVQAGTRILVDGHNRLRIWRDGLVGIAKEPVIIERPFSDGDAVKEWILRRQLARRNLTDAMRVKIALQLQPLLQAKAKKHQQLGRGTSLSAAGIAAIRTDEEIAKAAGVSRDTVRKVQAVLDRGTADLANSMLSGNVSIHRAHSISAPNRDAAIGMHRAHQAISILRSIPAADAERARALAKVSQWVFDNNGA